MRDFPLLLMWLFFIFFLCFVASISWNACVIYFSSLWVTLRGKVKPFSYRLMPRIDYTNFVHEMQTHSGKQKRTRLSQFYYLWAAKPETLWSDFPKLDRKENGMLRNFLNLAILLFLLFLWFTLASMEILASISW